MGVSWSDISQNTVQTETQADAEPFHFISGKNVFAQKDRKVIYSFSSRRTYIYLPPLKGGGRDFLQIKNLPQLLQPGVGSNVDKWSIWLWQREEIENNPASGWHWRGDADPRCPLWGWEASAGLTMRVNDLHTGIYGPVFIALWSWNQ